MGRIALVIAVACVALARADERAGDRRLAALARIRDRLAAADRLDSVRLDSAFPVGRNTRAKVVAVHDDIVAFVGGPLSGSIGLRVAIVRAGQLVAVIEIRNVDKERAWGVVTERGPAAPVRVDDEVCGLIGDAIGPRGPPRDPGLVHPLIPLPPTAEIVVLCDVFAESHVSPTSALAIVDNGHLFVFGGAGARNGTSVVLVGTPPLGRIVLRGGDAGLGGCAGRSAWLDPATDGLRTSDPNPGGLAARGSGFLRGSEDGPWMRGILPWMRGMTGRNGPRAAEGGVAELPAPARLAELARAVDDLATVWGDATRRTAGIVAMATLRPAHGAVAAFSRNQRLFVMLGASGGAGEPDGVSVEVAGAVAPDVLAIAGDAGPVGRPGTAVGPDTAQLVQGR